MRSILKYAWYILAASSSRSLKYCCICCVWQVWRSDLSLEHRYRHMLGALYTYISTLKKTTYLK